MQDEQQQEDQPSNDPGEPVTVAPQEPETVYPAKPPEETEEDLSEETLTITKSDWLNLWDKLKESKM